MLNQSPLLHPHHTVGSNLPIMAISESWLKNYLTDAQILINNYTPIRGDRCSRKGGGTLLYIHQSIPISLECPFDDSICQATFCVLETMSSIVINVYRPPNASYSSFNALLQKAQEYLDDVMCEKY